MKILTMAAAADRLGWDYRFETTLEAAGRIAHGMLTGDLVVTGSGDPSIVAQDLRHAAVFGEWADALTQAGIRRVDGRLIGDDNAFDDERHRRGVGVGLSHRELRRAVRRAQLQRERRHRARHPGDAAGEPAHVVMVPPGSQFESCNNVATGRGRLARELSLTRLPGSAAAHRPRPGAGQARPVSRTTTIDNPTRFFRRSLAAALGRAGIAVSGGAWDIDDLEHAAGLAGADLVARRESLPLSRSRGYFMKDRARTSTARCS